MKPLISLALVAGLAAPVVAQEPAQDENPKPPVVSQETLPAPTFKLSRIDFGLQGVDVDTASSRFYEYRSVPRGPNLPYFRFFGQTEKLRYDLRAKNVLQSDAQYRLVLAPDWVRLTGEYNKIPHVFGNDGRTLLARISDSNFVISDTLQSAFQGALVVRKGPGPGAGPIDYTFLNNLVAPSLRTAEFVDLALLRERGSLEARLTKTEPLDVRFTYAHEARRGTRAVGTSFGFGNVVESPEPINYRTQDVGVNAEWSQSWGFVRGALNYNWFTNNVPSHTWDNPFRVTDSTDASAYQSPGSASINGPSFGRATLGPDNSAVNGNVGVLVKLAKRTRLSASLGIGQWTQDETAFIPYTTNTAITGLPGLPASQLDGKIDTTSFSASLTTQPATGLSLVGRYRHYKLDNKTGRLSFPGYVRFDAVFEDIPRISVPYGNTQNQASLTATYMFGNVTVEGGWRLEEWERDFRETEKTTQNTFAGKVDVRTSDWLTLRGTIEAGSRDFDGLEIILSEEASFLEPGDPANLLAVPDHGSGSIAAVYASLGCGGKVCNLRYDQAAKDLSRYGVFAMLTPGGKATLTLSYLKGKDDYKDTRFGLINDERDTFGIEGDYTFSERANVYALYTRENIKNFQRGRQSGATVSPDPLADWTSNVEDKADTFGGGANFTLVKDKLDLKLNGTYQKVDGNNEIASPPGGTPNIGVPIPNFDDTKITNVGGEFGYHATKDLLLALGGWYEEYEIDDAQTSGLVYYVPGSLFLNPVDSNYKATVFYVRATYAW